MRRAFASLGLLVVAGCAGDEQLIVCPPVEAVAGLDRLDQSYPGASVPVRTSLDVVAAVCERDGDEVVVGSAIAVRLDANRPPGPVTVPFTVAVDTPSGIVAVEAETLVVPPGAGVVTAGFEHRFTSDAAGDEIAARVLYSLVPDAREYERLEQERPRP